MTVLAPCDPGELRQMLEWTLTQEAPAVIRYSRAGDPVPENSGRLFKPGKWNSLTEGEDLSLLCMGTMVRRGLEISRRLREKGIHACVYNCSSVKPLDPDALKAVQRHPYFTLEEHMLTGGFGAFVRSACAENGLRPPEECYGVPDTFLQHGSHELLMKDAGLTPDILTQRIMNRLKGAEHGQQGKS